MNSPRQPASADPAREFAHPKQIVAAPTLDLAAKLALLDEWEYDVRLLLGASEENMTGKDNGKNAELLKAIHDARAELGNTDDRGRGVHKTGTS